MNRFASYRVRRAAEIDAEFAHARHVVVPALLYAVGLTSALMLAALRAEPESTSEQLSSPQMPAVSEGA